MAKRSGLFGGGSRSVANKLTAPKPRACEVVDASKEALEERLEKRNQLPELLPGISLTIKHKNKLDLLHHDFGALCKRHPSQDLLIRQLCLGIWLAYHNKTSSITTWRNVTNSTAIFIEFTNAPNSSVSQAITSVADINITTCKSFSNWLVTTENTRGRKLYGAVRRSVHALQTKYPDQEDIGAKFTWPNGPEKKEKPIEGYGLSAYNDITKACEADIKKVINLHLLFDKIELHAEPIRLDEWNLPNVMYWLLELEKDTRMRRTDKELLFVSLGAASPKRDRFLSSQGLKNEDVWGLWESQGEESAKRGERPTKGDKGAQWTVDNLMFWVKDIFENSDSRFVSRRGLALRRLKAPKPKEWLKQEGLSAEHTADLFVERGSELALKGRSPYADKIEGGRGKEGALNTERSKRLFKSLLVTLKRDFPDFPFYISLESGSGFFATNRIGSESYRPSPEKKEIYGLARRSCFSARWDLFGELCFREVVYGAMHFIPDTIYPIYLLVMLNTGWNLESVFAITDDVDKHVTPDLIDPDNYVLIVSTKVKGQSKGGRPSFKHVYHRCNKSSKFGTYRLLKYVESIVTRWRDSPHYIKGRLWQFAVPSYGSRTSVISTWEGYGLHAVSKKFLARHAIDSVPGDTVDHLKVRSGYVAAREALGLSEYEISGDMDHGSPEVTSINYASDSSSNRIKDITIAQLQQQFLNDLANISSRLVQSTSLANLRSAIAQCRTEADKAKAINKAARETGLESKTIVHLLDAGSQKYIAACEDPKKPTWPNHEVFVKDGQKCRFFNKCCLCNKSIIFPEALAFVSRRVMDLEELQGNINGVEWVVNYGDEYEAWKQVLASWNNREQVDQAAEKAKNKNVVLPHVMRGI